MGHIEDPLISQKSHRMRATDYSRGFVSNLEAENGATAEVDPRRVKDHKADGGSTSPTKVFRSWSRPQLAGHELADLQGGDAGHQDPQMRQINGKVLKTMQVCTCARFRKRIEPSHPMADHINVGTLNTIDG